MLKPEHRIFRSALAAQLGHSSQSLTGHYVKMVGPDRRQDSEQKALAAFIKGVSAILKERFYIETTFGVCPAVPLACAPHLQSPCSSAPMEQCDSSQRDRSRGLHEASHQAPFAPGLLREGSDLDRTDALTAHLSALDQQLHS